MPKPHELRPVPPSGVEACAAAILDVLPTVMAAVRTGMRRQLQGGLSVPQFRCLNYIDLHPGASVSGVAAFLGVTLATASAMVDRLVRAGYAMTGVSSEDRRRSALNISPTGTELLGRMKQGARGDLAAALGGRSPAELASIVEGLAVLRSAFGTSP
jgi:DNA-binding MarR family transcriptional regulator